MIRLTGYLRRLLLGCCCIGRSFPTFSLVVGLTLLATVVANSFK